MVAWVGYAQIAIPYERAARVASKSNYPLHKMLAFGWTAATSFSILPLRIIMTFGMVVMLFGVEEALRPILAHIFNCYTVRGWSELMVISVLGRTIMSIGMRAGTSAKFTNSRKSVRYT
jgi:dolichol-phosphate mannosyltransferase